MAGTQNFTTLVKDEMVNVFKSCINEGNAPYFEVYHITDFLSKEDAHMTPGMFLCRYVQTNYKSFVSTQDGTAYFANLDKSYPNWDSKIIDRIAETLRDNTDITLPRWKALLSRTYPKKDVDRFELYHVAFDLQMSKYEAAQYFLLNRAALPCVRNPLDTICSAYLTYYSIATGDQKVKIKWTDVVDDLDEFVSKIQVRRSTAAETHEMYKFGPRKRNESTWVHSTNLRSSLNDDIIKAYTANYEEFRSALRTYMSDNAPNFVPIEKSTKRDYNYITENAYSITAVNTLKQLLRYLTVLYPACFPTIAQSNVPYSKTLVDYPLTTDHLPVHIKDLTSAMLDSVDWEHSDWKAYAEAQSDPENKIHNTSNELQYIDTICKNLYTKIGNTLNVIDNKATGVFIDRDDILMLTYFLIKGYTRYYNENKTRTVFKSPFDGIAYKYADGQHVDDAVEQIAEIVDNMAGTKLDLSDQIQYAMDEYNVVLDAFGSAYGVESDYSIAPIYLPLKFDRFVILATIVPNAEDIAELMFSTDSLDEARYLNEHPELGSY